MSDAMKNVLTPLATALLLGGCAVAPVPAPEPPVALSPAFRGAGDPARVAEVADARWWFTFGDATLVTLVEQALQRNHDIAAAVQRVQAARAGLDAQASRLWPTVGLQAGAARSSTGLPAATKQGLPDTRALRLGADLSWEVLLPFLCRLTPVQQHLQPDKQRLGSPSLIPESVTPEPATAWLAPMASKIAVHRPFGAAALLPWCVGRLS